MASAPEIPLSSDSQRGRQSLAGVDLESLDEDVAVTDRATAAANYRGVQPWLFGVAAAGFATVAGLIAASIAIAVMALELGSASERVRDLNTTVHEKSEAFDASNTRRIECEAALRQMNQLLDRVAPLRGGIGGR